MHVFSTRFPGVLVQNRSYNHYRCGVSGTPVQADTFSWLDLYLSGAQYYKIHEVWEKVTKIMKVSGTPVYLGNGLPGRDKRARHEGHFYLYKSKEKGRKFKHSKDRAARAMMTKKNRQAGKSPWLIFTNTTQLRQNRL